MEKIGLYHKAIQVERLVVFHLLKIIAGGLLVMTVQSSEPQTPVGPVTPVAAEKAIIVVTANQGPPKGDPIAVVNEVSFGAVQSVDKAIIAPIAYGYRDGLPRPIRDGMHNVLNNLDEPVVFLNFLLQLCVGSLPDVSAVICEKLTILGVRHEVRLR